MQIQYIRETIWAIRYGFMNSRSWMKNRYRSWNSLIYPCFISSFDLRGFCNIISLIKVGPRRSNTVVYQFGKSYSPEHDKRWGTLDIPRIPIPILHFTPDSIHPGHGLIPLTGNPSECNFPIVTSQFGRKA